jgi:hypothetical protein
MREPNLQNFRPARKEKATKDLPYTLKVAQAVASIVISAASLYFAWYVNHTNQVRLGKIDESQKSNVRLGNLRSSKINDSVIHLSLIYFNRGARPAMEFSSVPILYQIVDDKDSLEIIPINNIYRYPLMIKGLDTATHKIGFVYPKRLFLKNGLIQPNMLLRIYIRYIDPATAEPVGYGQTFKALHTNSLGLMAYEMSESEAMFAFTKIKLHPEDK